MAYWSQGPNSIASAPAPPSAEPSSTKMRVGLRGGALMDIGCYPVHVSRFVYGAEPRRVLALVERDPEMQTDRLTSAILEFETGRAAFTCSTQLAAHQRVELLGTRGRVEVEIPFNAPPDRPTRIFVDDGSALGGASAEVIEFAPCDQYTIQGDLFSRAVREGTAQPIPLEDAVGNMAVIDALFRSAESGGWEVPA